VAAGSRPGRRHLPALATTAAAVLALGLAVALARPAGGAPAQAAPAAVSGAVPARQVALRESMRKLWEDHVTWTRMVIVDVAGGLPSLRADEARLLRNQADIGNAVVPYYGRAAGRRLTGLLRDHILIAADLLTAAKTDDGVALSRAQAAWRVNADRIAGFLAAANPASWPRSHMRSMMRGHLALTTDEAVARLAGRFADDVRAYDRVHGQILEMADMLSEGIVRQFPARFR